MPLPLGAALLGLAVVGLLVGVRRGPRSLEVAAKTAASGLLVALAFGRWLPGDPVATGVLVGLALCALGDVLLLDPHTFDAGLVAFLAGHLAYLAAFAAALTPTRWCVAPLAPLALLGLASLRWLWPHLGRRRAAVSLYVAAITAMAWGAVAAARGGAVGWTAAPGALLFLLSDLAVARHRFVRPAFANRLLGLPAYYLGQLLLVLAAGGPASW